jgi:hypothetical protein
MEDIFNYLLENSEPLILSTGAGVALLTELTLYSETRQAEQKRKRLDNYAEGHFQANSNDLLDYKGHQVSPTSQGLAKLKKSLEEETKGSIEQSDEGFLKGAYDALK